MVGVVVVLCSVLAPPVVVVGVDWPVVVVGVEAVVGVLAAVELVLGEELEPQAVSARARAPARVRAVSLALTGSILSPLPERGLKRHVLATASTIVRRSGPSSPY